jgi:endonuclease YncB( thermonuclease family)
MAKKKRSYPRTGKRSRSGSVVMTPLFLLAIAAAGWFGFDKYLADYIDIPGIATSTETASNDSDAEAPAAKPAPASTPKGSEVTGTASVVDADTLDIHGERIRLVGVDAPESKQQCRNGQGTLYRCGQMAANALDLWINSNPVTCAIEDKDRYGRSLGQCSVRGTSVQEWLVANGHALAYRSYSKQYVPAEEKAEAAKTGIWAAEFVKPWDWRKGVRLEGEKPTKSAQSSAKTSG